MRNSYLKICGDMSEENNDNKLPKELLLYDGSEDKIPMLQTGILGEISKMDSVLNDNPENRHVNQRK